MERWKWVVGYEGSYEVSDLGRVRSVDRVVRGPRGGPKKLVGKVLRPSPRGRCVHLVVNLCKKGKKESCICPPDCAGRVGWALP